MKPTRDVILNKRYHSWKAQRKLPKEELLKIAKQKVRQWKYNLKRLEDETH